MSTRPAEELDGAPVVGLVGSVLAGRYRVDRLLGEGGMGRVYLAEHVLMRKPVALKVLHPELTTVPEVVARFEREAVAAARIDHPNVAQAMDFGRLDDGSLYFVMEYVAGRTLRAILDDEGALGLERSLPIAQQVASALVAAHGVGIVHRDLKPDNVMLVPQPDGSDRVKVLDFGIAKVSSDGPPGMPAHTLTRIGVVMGTVGYMSPEQALGQAVDHLADLYAFGAMLFEMLSGHLPFRAEEVSQLLAKQLTEEPPPLSGDLPSELNRLVSTLLAKTPSERAPSNAASLLEALDTLAEQSAVVGAPTVFIEAPPAAALAAGTNEPAASARVAVTRTHAEMPVRRHPVLWATGAAVVLLVGLGLARWRSAATADLVPGVSGDAPQRASDSVAAVPASSAVSGVSAAAVSPAAVSSGVPAPASPPMAPPSSETRGAETLPARAPAETAASRTQSSTTESTSSERGGVTRTRKTKRTHSEERTVKRTRRHTGPGGIYIPPPSQWFK